MYIIFSLLRTEFQLPINKWHGQFPHIIRYSNKIVEKRFLFSAAVVFPIIYRHTVIAV